MVHGTTAVEWTTADGTLPAKVAADSNPFDAANECPHGHLPHDRRITCDCFGTLARVIEFPARTAPALDEEAA